MIAAALFLALAASPSAADAGNLIYCRLGVAKNPVPPTVEIEQIGEVQFALRITKVGKRLRASDYQVDDPSGLFVTRVPEYFFPQDKGLALMFKRRVGQSYEALVLTHEDDSTAVPPYRSFQGDLVGKPDGTHTVSFARGGCVFTNTGGSFEELQRLRKLEESRGAERAQ